MLSWIETNGLVKEYPPKDEEGCPLGDEKFGKILIRSLGGRFVTEIPPRPRNLKSMLNSGPALVNVYSDRDL